MTGEVSCRLFRLDGTAYEFQCRRVNLHQSLLVKPNGGQSVVPLTRHDWYRSDDWQVGSLSTHGNDDANGSAPQIGDRFSH